MLKCNETTDPTSCWNKALDSEMLFVLLGRDAAAADTIRFWIAKRIQLGLNKFDDAQIVNATTCADLMEKYQSLYAVASKEEHVDSK